MNSVYFTGGECFLLGTDLIKANEFSTGLGLATRNVWGKRKTKNKTLSLVKKIRLAGVKEIKVSSEDDHPKYVSLESMLNAAIACSSEGV